MFPHVPTQKGSRLICDVWVPMIIKESKVELPYVHDTSDLMKPQPTMKDLMGPLEF